MIILTTLVLPVHGQNILFLLCISFDSCFRISGSLTFLIKFIPKGLVRVGSCYSEIFLFISLSDRLLLVLGNTTGGVFFNLGSHYEASGWLGMHCVDQASLM